MSISVSPSAEYDQETPDQELIESILSEIDGVEQRKASFSALYIRYETMVFAIVLRRLRNRAWAAEVTQDIFTHAFTKIHQIREAERFKGWLKQIAVRMAINAAVRKDPDEFGNGSAGESGASKQSVDVMRNETVAVVQRVLALLPEQSQQILEYFYLQNMSIKDIQDELNIPEGTVKRRLFTARMRMRERLTELWPEYAESPLADL